MHKVQRLMMGLLPFFLFSLIPLTAGAQPSWAKKATKGVFTLKTFTADGTLLASSNGFFTSEGGEAVSNFAPFRGASRAIVIDAAGKEYAVECMLGADDTYDIAKFRVDIKKATPLPIATGTAPAGATAWLLPYRETKALRQGTVRKAETVRQQYAYYTVAMPTPEEAVSCPLLNEAGEVLGLMQQPASQQDTLSYAVSALMADSLSITGLSINDPTLRSTHIRKDLPESLDQANLTVYVARPQLDSASYASLVEDFIRKFPTAPDGYTYRAQIETDASLFDAADSDMQKAVSVADKKDEAHFSYSKLIYQKELYMADVPYPTWSLDKALSEVQAAIALNPQPIYRHHEAVVLFAQQKYDEACALFLELTTTDMAGAQLYYEVSRCKQQLNDTTAQLELLDKAVGTFSRPYLREAAPYLLARAETRLDAGKYRDAVNDFNDYEQLMQTTVNANFYYIRSQAELGGRMYQLALNDINRAIELSPDSDVYRSEKASLCVRFGLYDDAIESAREAIRLAPGDSDGYLFLGIAQCQKGQKEEGFKNLQRARELGDAQAEALIERYSK